MENYKIITTSDKYPDVLIYRDRGEDEEEIVIIHAIGKMDDLEDIISWEKINVENSLMGKLLIKNFTKEAAEIWCEDKGISYC